MDIRTVVNKIICNSFGICINLPIFVNAIGDSSIDDISVNNND